MKIWKLLVPTDLKLRLDGAIPVSRSSKIEGRSETENLAAAILEGPTWKLYSYYWITIFALIGHDFNEDKLTFTFLAIKCIFR